METYIEYSEREQEFYARYRIGYAQKNPPPKKPSAISALADPYTYMLVIVTLGSLLLTSLRTAEQFFRSAMNSWLGEWVAWTEAALAIISVEGAMVVYSMIRAKKIRATYDGRWLVVGIGITAFISIVASLGQSVNFIDQLPETLNNGLQWALTFVIGPIGAVAAVIGGHLIGAHLSDLSVQNEGRYSQYEKELDEWLDGLNRSWNANKKKIIGNYQTEQPVTQYQPPVPEGRTWGYGELRGAIEDWFQTNKLSLDDSVDYQQIADEIGHHSSETVRVTISKMRK